MGQFDKQAAPKPAEQKKKTLIAVLLAAALAGVLGMQMLKNSPRPAMAAPAAGGQDAVADALTPQPRSVTEELDELAKDPTAPFLRGEQKQDAAFLTPPRDPFRMSDAWKATLVRVSREPGNTEPQRVEPKAAPVVPQGADVSAIKVQGIFRENQKLTAIVNGTIVHTGMVIKNVRIIEIQDDRIVVQNASYPNGPHSEIRLKAKLNN